VLDKVAVLFFFALGRANAQGLHEYIAFDVQISAGHDVVNHAHAFKQSQVLEGSGNAHFCHLSAVHVAEGLTTERNAAFLGFIDTIDTVQHGTFASAVGPNDGSDFMLANVE